MKKRTKIIGTIGPVTENYESLKILSEKGINIFRLNFSHGEYSWHENVIKRIKKLNKNSKENFAILLDTKGPEIRTGDLKKPLELKKGDELILTPDFPITEISNRISVDYGFLAKDIEVGEKILIDNGVMNFIVTGIKKKDVMVEVLDGGILKSRRHLNLPGKEVSLDAITKKDWEDIDFGIKMGVDFIALSFVRTAEEVLELKEYLKKKKAKIDVISKIESYEATQNIEEIIQASDSVMIARGDLGAEIPFSKVPQIQKKIVDLCSLNKTPVIVATHMLESMIENPIPTRAEVTDIYSAVRQKVDCTMLSGETASGEFPIKSVKAMVEVISETENNQLKNWSSVKCNSTDSRSMFSRMASETSLSNEMSAIIVITRSGFMANLISSCRPKKPIFAFTNTPSTRRKAQILWGTEGFGINFSKTPDKTINRACKKLLEHYPEYKGKKYILVSDSLVDNEFIPTLQIRKF